LYWSSRSVKSKFVLAMAADIDATGFKERYLYFYKKQKMSPWFLVSGLLVEIIQPFLLRNADYILTQHEGQEQILAKKKIKSFIFRNLLDLSRFPVVDHPAGTDFIFVSTWLSKRKGFMELFQLIQMCPEQPFTIIGSPS